MCTASAALHFQLAPCAREQQLEKSLTAAEVRVGSLRPRCSAMEEPSQTAHAWEVCRWLTMPGKALAANCWF